jgi:DNA modification methylase
MINLNEIYNEDCLVGMSRMNSDMVDLIILDIPYNVTNNDWDKFESQKDYLNFLHNVLCECQRVLKETGSIYLFHNNFLQMCEIQRLIENSTIFVFRQLITWNKKFDGSFYEWRKDATLQKENLKNFSKYAEYILFYTFDGKSPSDQLHHNKENFHDYKHYIQSLLNKKELAYNSPIIVETLYKKMNYKSMQSARSISQRLFNPNYKAFGVINKKQYEIIKNIVGIDISYDDLFELYSKDLKIAKDENPTIRYTFNNLGTHHSVWNYNNVPNSKKIHPTEKPIDLLENILLYSSKEGDIVLDPFGGSGSTAEACIKTKRKYILFENDTNYYKDCRIRINRLLNN